MSHHNTFYLDACVRQIQIERLIRKNKDKIWVNAVNTRGETPLHIAAKNRNLQLFKSFLPYYNNIETTDNQGNTVLHVLADVEASRKRKDFKKKCNALFGIVLSKGADINKQNQNGWSPIHYAAKYCHIDMLKIAKLFNANFNLTTFDGETPLLIVCKNKLEAKGSSEEIRMTNFLKRCSCDISAIDDESYSTLYNAVKKCSVNVVKVISDHETDILVCTKYHKFASLHFAIKNRNLPLLKILSGVNIITQNIQELTPQQISVLECSSDVVKYLITNGADLNCRDKVFKLTPLHLTICSQRRDLFEFLIEKGANVNLPDEDGLTPLHISSILGCIEFTKILLENGAEVNCRSINQFTPLHLVTMQSHLEDNFKPVISDFMKNVYKKALVATSLKFPDNSIERNYKDVIQLLLCHGADVNALTSSGWSPLLFATELERDTDNFMKILVENGANVNYVKPRSGFTALHFASQNNSDTKIEVLINAGADVNTLSQEGRAPLHLAIKRGCAKAFKMLIKHGASVDVKETGSQRTPLQLALEKKYENAAKILINAGADVNCATSDGKSPVYLALESNYMDVMKLLIFRGADVNYKQPHSQLTALHVALKNNNENVAAKLIDAGADVNALTGDGKSPIHLAIESLSSKSHLCEADHRDIVKILIDAGADVNVLAANGTSTLHLALKSNCKQLIKFLIKNRVKLNCKRRRCLYSLLYVTAQSNEDLIDELDDSHKTPLISVAMNVKNPDIKKAIYRLSALVDAPNVRSCMYRNFDVNNCYCENLACLRACGEYFYHTEAYNKFITYRVLSGDFDKFSNRPVINASHHKDLCKYLFMLNAVNLPLTTKSETLKPPSDDEIWDYDKKCKDEVRKLQKYLISGVTLYDVLHMKPRRRRLYMNNFNISEIADEFKMYCKLILTYYYEDKIRSILMETALSAFFQLTILHLPSVCLDEIFWNLDIVDIIAIIEAAERID